MIKEVALENFTNVPKAIRAGANRIELCDNLAVGGTTVSKGVMAETQKYANDHHIPVMAMIRPRGGNFVYTDTELKIMEADVFQAQELGIDGVVFGALHKNGTLDTDALEMLIAAAGGMQITFHMAFDAIPKAKQSESIDWLAEAGIDRILTHGGDLDTPITTHYADLKQIIKDAHQRLIILPGGGITSRNLAEVTDELGVSEAHGTRIVGQL
ncbi:copper homeostasis protein CutC [Pediococcus damnosus]|uniref:copper homeostasis protein CutC n=1 Tax=Pediococcus damnosus TaxID=51663 RepID=UPI00061F5DA2|nr:copper homeostasis protein CutC [Pediococcus damnosus]KJU73990.1 copper homeostasis protein CutC [Pediococcus damnosus LMG 28219]PIO82021.1 copper homeostasis protein CutC [Pediococcus damnosus]PIO86254.1 copper homeostasis protein CutC [Pediococcus damnosus]PJE50318.1 copper homeostasis protein CutC [Pediococcus damnosus]